MFLRKKIDAYLIAAILVVLGVDLAVFFFSPSPLIPIIWMLISLNIKGWICCWNHHHQHLKFFYPEWANRALELAMGLQTGIVGEAWVLHHTFGHHVNYLDQTKDESAWKDETGRTMPPLEYAWTVTIQAYPKALKVGEKYPKVRVKLIQNMVATTIVLLALASVNWVNTLIQFVFPMVFLLFMTAYVTYEHHAGLDEEDPYKATYNVTDRWYNFFTCNLGYHTAHHVQCGRHWSELPQFHEEIKDKIPATLYRDAGFPFAWITKAEQILAEQGVSWNRG